MAVKVLVVDDDLNIQRVLSFTLKQEGFDVILAGDGETGVALAAEQVPDLILMDAVLPGIDGYQAIAQIRGAEPAGRRAPILLLTTEADVVQRVKGLRAGADDDIVKPFHPAELMARIRALLARSGLGGPRAGSVQATLRRVIVFYGAKGGVGNTTLAINTAIALASEHKRRVALIDANLQFGDLRVFLDLKLDTASIVNAISEPELDTDLLRRLMVSHSSGIDLLLAPAVPEQADVVMDSHRASPEALTHIIELMRGMYDYTVIDAARSLDHVTIHLFDEADVVYVVLTADLSCLKNVQLVLKTMTELGYPRDKIQLVLNRSNAFTGINIANAESVLGRPIGHKLINEYRGAIGALNSGAPFMISRPGSPLAKAVSDFAVSVDKELSVVESEA
ncbi:MAG TPA: response regulator [Candidatus Limnocylindria bacterium]|jgi:pilus assembly protein CpaE|nr:response regulator [Candidatus Limnocylindria bacterium]